jgi:CheY-like chemotaxis protein
MDRNPGPLRVLVVDDDRDTTSSLAALIGLWGHAAAEANDGRAALARAAAFCPDVALLDLGLPGMSGFEVAQRLRAEVAAPLFLVALTGFSEGEYRDLCRAVGFDHFMVKPPSPNKIRALLDAQAALLDAAVG